MRSITFLLGAMVLLTVFAPSIPGAEMDRGVFSSTDTGISGQYTSFSLNDDLGGLPLYMVGPNMSGRDLITSFSLLNNRIFSDVSFSAIGNVTMEQVGNSFVLDGTGGRLEIHDNPSGIMVFDSYSSGELELTAAEGISLRVENNTVLLDRQGTAGYIFVTGGGINISGNTALISLDSGSKTVFRAFPYLTYTGEESAVMSSVLAGKIAGELYISREGDLVRDDYSAFDAGAAQTSMVRSDRIGVAVKAGSGGKIVLIHIPSDMMSEVGRITIDGKEPAEAPSLSQMLDYSGAPNAQYVQRTGNYSTVMVYLSEAGEHTIDIKESSGSALSVGDYLTMSVGASFVVLAALLLYRRT